MKKFNRCLLGLMCTCLTACNSGGVNPETNNNTNSKELNWRFSWSAPIASLFQKGLGWYVSIQNDSDYTYVVQAIKGSSRVKGEDTWEEDTELDRSTTIPPHTTKVIYGESYTNGPKSFNLSTTDGSIKNQIITLHKDHQQDSDDFYITNDSYNTRGEAIFNHGAEKSLNSASTITALIGDSLMIFGGPILGGEAAGSFATRAAVSEIIKDFSIKEAADMSSLIADETKLLNDELTDATNAYNALRIARSTNFSPEEAQAYETSKATIAKLSKDMDQMALDNALNKIASEYNQRLNLNLTPDEIQTLSKCLEKIYKADTNVKLTSATIQKMEARMLQQGNFGAQLLTDNDVNIMKAHLQIFKDDSNEATELVSRIIKSGYIVPTSTKVIGAAIGELFGTGATYGVINSLDIAGKDAVFTSLQINNTGVANVGSFNNAPVGSYLLTCDNLGSESDVAIAMCKKDHESQPHISMLSVTHGLRKKENIINKDGVIRGGDQYHDHCSYSYNNNGVIYALCDVDDKLLKLDYQHDCADNAEVRFENNRLVCSQYRYQYLNTCTPVDVSSPVEGMITAQCKDYSGADKLLKLDYKHDCTDNADVRFENNRLICSQYRYQYLNTCTPVDISSPVEGMITAQCKDYRGVYTEGWISIDTTLCANGSDIINRNASLVCAEYIPQLPKGVYRDNCTITYYDQQPKDVDFGEIGAICRDQTGISQFEKLNYLKECAPNSTISLDSNGHLHCDQSKSSN